MSNILKDLFINMTILISFISLSSQIMKNKDLNVTFNARIMCGIVLGLLGILLMLFSVHIGNNTLIDYKYVVIAMSAIHLGNIVTIICGLIIALFRILYFGVDLSSIVGFLIIIIIMIGDSIIVRFKLNQLMKWIVVSVFNIGVSSIILSFLLNGQTNIFYFLIAYISSTCIVTILVYYYLDFCLTANKLFRKLLMESSKDFLTGLNNVRSFDENYNKSIQHAVDHGEKLALLMIDIDFFKKVNDTYGHGDGDLVLHDLGSILVKNCRGFDIVSRNGGEEFTALLLDCSKEQALQIAERIRSKVQAHPFVLSSGKVIHITVSIGVACYPECLVEPDKLLEVADTALYTAKHSGRNRVCLDHCFECLPQS